MFKVRFHFLEMFKIHVNEQICGGKREKDIFVNIISGICSGQGVDKPFSFQCLEINPSSTAIAFVIQ